MLTYLEDYLEFIGGYRTLAGKLNPVGMANVRLANYDQNIVNTLGYQTSTGNGLTDRQYELAKKIVHKYRKQLQQKGVTVPEVLELRIPIRYVDRSQTLSHNEATNRLIVKFPFRSDLVDSIRNLVSISCGEFLFDRDQKVWRADCTLPNLVWLVNWAQKNNFEIRFDHNQLLEQLYNEIAIPSLKLVNESSQQLDVDHNPGSIDIESINSSDQNLIHAICRASDWQINIDPLVIKCAEKQGYSSQWLEWSSRRMLHVRPSPETELEFFRWLDTIDIWPVVWHSDQPTDYDSLKSHFGVDRVMTVNKQKIKGRNSIADRLVLYTERLPNSLSDVGIFVTRQSVIYQIKRRWGQNSRKIVYWGDRLLTDIAK